MKILIDAMGGDNAPLEILKGASLASNEYIESICLVGKEDKLRALAKENGIYLSKMAIYNANDVISMDDSPLLVRTKTDSSLRVGFELLKNGEVDAFVSAGSTGALHTGATLYVPKISGIKRSAIATILPFESPVLLLDSGANLTLSPEYMKSLAIMGSIYMKNLYGIENVRVGLLNNGTESSKGTSLQVDSYKVLSECQSINFVGNIEASMVMNNTCDVLVTDGFTGNILLKTIEGMGKFFMSSLKPILKKNLLAAIMLKKDLTAFKKCFDASEHGGAPLLGLAMPVIKAHGSSDSRAVKNAVGQAINIYRTSIIHKIEDELRLISQKEP